MSVYNDVKIVLPNAVSLQEGEIHIWRIALDGSEVKPEQLFALLQHQEQVKAQRFYFDRDRARYVVAHGALRLILSSYLGLPPDALYFGQEQYGKPTLLNESMIRFNLSHSHGLALCAVTRNRHVGVDVEFIRPEIDCRQIAERYFSDEEIFQLNNLSPLDYVKGFFNCWTRKEAYIKALGEGLSRRLDSFSVSLTPGTPARLLNAANGTQDSTPWSITALEVDPSYAGAVVAEELDFSLIFRQWPD